MYKLLWTQLCLALIVFLYLSRMQDFQMDTMNSVNKYYTCRNIVMDSLTSFTTNRVIAHTVIIICEVLYFDSTRSIARSSSTTYVMNSRPLGSLN